MESAKLAAEHRGRLHAIGVVGPSEEDDFDTVQKQVIALIEEPEERVGLEATLEEYQALLGGKLICARPLWSLCEGFSPWPMLFEGRTLPFPPACKSQPSNSVPDS